MTQEREEVGGGAFIQNGWSAPLAPLEEPSALASVVASNLTELVKGKVATRAYMQRHAFFRSRIHGCATCGCFGAQWFRRDPRPKP